MALAAVMGIQSNTALRPPAHWPLHAVVDVWISTQDQPPSGDRLVERAMQTWTKASDGRLTLQRTLVRTDADIQVFFNQAGGNYLHELGHAIGLEDTANFSDIMYLFRRPDDGPRYFGNYRALLRSADDIGGAKATGLSADDVKALRDLYE